LLELGAISPDLTVAILTGGSIAYRTSKAAVNMVTRSAAIDLAPQGVICVVINPAWVKTEARMPL
jgi:NAD(P)-dependent dehydrogenase (short-subunit alcohol dehydrogenase family)